MASAFYISMLEKYRQLVYTGIESIRESEVYDNQKRKRFNGERRI